MKSVVGIFTAKADAERTVDRLRSAGIRDDYVSLLAPGASEERVHAVATTETEQPGMGKAIGGVVGGAIGASGGMMLGAAAATLLIPGVGPVLATGIIGAALLGAGGAVAGAAAGEELEEGMADGLPKDELFVYEDALRQGRSVIIAMTKDEQQYEEARSIMEESGAESIDAARDNWWLGLRDDEEAAYSAEGKDFKKDEPVYRRGFESALHPKARGKTYEEADEFISSCYGDICNEPSFRRGYERGQDYHRGLKETRND